jgi:hypothetical protein
VLAPRSTSTLSAAISPNLHSCPGLTQSVFSALNSRKQGWLAVWHAFAARLLRAYPSSSTPHTLYQEVDIGLELTKF